MVEFLVKFQKQKQTFKNYIYIYISKLSLIFENIGKIDNKTKNLEVKEMN